MASPAIRYAYCKSGDVVAELDSLGPQPLRVPATGPQHYIGSFLSFIGDRPALLLSLCSRDALLSRGAVKARAVRYKSAPTQPLHSAWMQLRAFHLVLTELREFRPTRILCASPGGPPLWACYLHSRLFKVPLVCTCHASVALRSRNPLRLMRQALNTQVLRTSAAVMCHGPYLHDQLHRLGVADTRVFQFNLAYGQMLLEDPSDDSVILPNLPHNSFVILYVGRIGREKGVFDLYNAARPLLKQQPEVYLVYAGAGRDLTALTKLVEHDGLGERVALLGSIVHSRLPNLYRMAQIIVTPTHSSSTESRCKVAIESLVVGRPVIAPDFGPFPYAIKHGHNGLLYKPDSVADLEHKLTELFGDRELLSNLTCGAIETGGSYITAADTFTEALARAFPAAE